ncbi:hypothetical protein [Paenisporosarcina cavernae]|nr:hypothetical protein [Paenisporosarcina cavernae]
MMKRIEDYFFDAPLNSSEKLFLGASAPFVALIVLSQIFIFITNLGE